MADYTFFFNPMSRAAIAQWAFAEAEADVEVVHVEWESKPRTLLDANPLGKLPTIIHHRPQGDVVVTETAAICHYLAEMDAPGLLPQDHEKGPYFRWLFFTAGPLEQAVTTRAMGWKIEADKRVTLGFGNFDLAIDALDSWLSENAFVAGERFTMADVYVGSQIAWGMMFGSIPERDSFKAYLARFNDRPAYRATLAAMSA